MKPPPYKELFSLKKNPLDRVLLCNYRVPFETIWDPATRVVVSFSVKTQIKNYIFVVTL